MSGRNQGDTLSLHEGKVELGEPDLFEEEKKNGEGEEDPQEAPRVLSTSPSDHNAKETNAQDPEALRPVQSNAPPYSIFSKRQKIFIVFMSAWGGFFSPLSANIYFPALTTLTKEFRVSDTLINLTLTSYMIFQGLAPTLFGDLADMAGRRPAFTISFIIYIGANIGLALQSSYAALFILRCLQSSGSSATIALGIGVVADISTSAERGMYMGYVTSGSMVAPVVAPIIGGVLSQFLGWRSIFWFLVIMSAVYLAPLLVAFPETARNVVGNGSIPPQGWNMSLLNYLEVRKARNAGDELTRTASRNSQRAAQLELARKRKLRLPNPLATLRVIKQKDAGLLLLYCSLVYTAFYTVIASCPYLFEEIYGFNDFQIGLCFIPYGVGALCAPLTAGRLMDWNYRRVAKKENLPIDKKRGDDLSKFPVERTRLTVAAPMLAVGIITVLCYGWTLEVETSLAAPLVLHFIMGWGLTGAFNCMSVLLIDYYPMSPSTATAALNLVRCWMGAGGTAAISPMIRAMGRGWCFTFVAAVTAASSPILWVLLTYGPKWREERRVKGNANPQTNPG